MTLLPGFIPTSSLFRSQSPFSQWLLEHVFNNPPLVGTDG